MAKINARADQYVRYTTIVSFKARGLADFAGAPSRLSEGNGRVSLWKEF